MLQTILKAGWLREKEKGPLRIRGMYKKVQSARNVNRICQVSENVNFCSCETRYFRFKGCLRRLEIVLNTETLNIVLRVTHAFSASLMSCELSWPTVHIQHDSVGWIVNIWTLNSEHVEKWFFNSKYGLVLFNKQTKEYMLINGKGQYIRERLNYWVHLQVPCNNDVYFLNGVFLYTKVGTGT